MKKDYLLVNLSTEELRSYLGGGYWVTEMVDGIWVLFWEEDK